MANRKKMKIENHLLPKIYETAKGIYEEKIDEKKGVAALSDFLNENSALFYVEAFLHLMKGEKFTRTINAYSADFLLRNILSDYGESQLKKSLKSLKLHIEYYEGIEKVRMKKMREVYDMFFKKAEGSNLISNVGELLQNLNTFESYLTGDNDSEKDYVSNLLKDGICFLAYKTENEMRFAPSRFIGYVNNNLESHISNTQKDGRETNKKISNIVGAKPHSDIQIEMKYLKYCKELGIEPKINGGKFNIERKYWEYILRKDFEVNVELSNEFPEGKIVQRTHLARERNSQVVILAKKNFIAKHGKLFCEICEFDFNERYGSIGENFIEGHHTVAVSEMPANYKTKPEEITMLCSNCHRMIHKRRPWLSLAELKLLLPAKKLI